MITLYRGVNVTEFFNILQNRLNFEEDNLYLFKAKYIIKLCFYTMTKLIESTVLAFVIKLFLLLIFNFHISKINTFKLFIFFVFLNYALSFLFAKCNYKKYIKTNIDLKNQNNILNIPCTLFTLKIFCLLKNDKMVIRSTEKTILLYKRMINHILISNILSIIKVDQKTKHKMFKRVLRERDEIKTDVLELLTKGDCLIFENSLKKDDMVQYVNNLPFQRVLTIVSESPIFQGCDTSLSSIMSVFQ